MEFIIPSSLAGIIAACLLVLFVAIQVMIDSFDINTTKRLYKQLVQIGKDHSRKSFTVVITLRKRAESIQPLLEHIYSLGYKELQVLVILKHSAGKNAQSKLMSMRRKNKWQGMRISSYKKGQSHQEVMHRYAKEGLVIELLPDSRLTPGFFDDMSYERLLNPQGTIVLKQQHQLDVSLTSAFDAHFELWTSLYPFVLKHVKRNRSSTPLFATIITPARSLTGRSFAVSSIQAIAKHLSLAKIASGVVILSAIGVILSHALEQNDIITLIAIIVVAYAVTYSINMLRQKARSITDRISLMLLSPFALIYGVVLTTCAAVLYISRPK
jgi:hypothetical protein